MTGGSFYATGADLANPKLSEGARKARSSFEARYLTKPELYGDVRILNWGDVSKTLPAEKFDFILTARSIHGWMQDEPNTVHDTFVEFHKALKPGGILAVEQHRAKAGTAPEKPASGYVTEAYVIEQAQKAGFTLVGKSEINANPKDTTDHPFGVWTLPPNLRSTPYGSGKDEDPAFDNKNFHKFGAEVTYRMLPWLAVSGRADRVAPNSKDDEETFHVISPKVIFRSNWNSHEHVTLAVERDRAGLEAAALEPADARIEVVVEADGRVRGGHDRVVGVGRQVDLAAVVGLEPPDTPAHLLDQRVDVGPALDLAVAEHADEPLALDGGGVLGDRQVHVVDRLGHGGLLDQCCGGAYANIL
jgi:predicted methyltransferase